MAGKIENKIAVVTGGTSGIGLATAKLLAAEGAKVFVTGRRAPELAAAVEQIGHGAVGIQGDVSMLEDLDRLFSTVKEQAGRLDILFANAGTAEHLTLEQVIGKSVRHWLLRERQGCVLLHAEGSATDAGWSSRCSECFHVDDQGNPWIRRVEREQGRGEEPSRGHGRTNSGSGGYA